MKALVIGGTGFLGQYIVDELLESSHQIAVLSRSPDKATRPLASDVEVVEGDVNSLDHEQWLQILATYRQGGLCSRR